MCIPCVRLDILVHGDYKGTSSKTLWKTDSLVTEYHRIPQACQSSENPSQPGSTPTGCGCKLHKSDFITMDPVSCDLMSLSCNEGREQSQHVSTRCKTCSPTAARRSRARRGSIQSALRVLQILLQTHLTQHNFTDTFHSLVEHWLQSEHRKYYKHNY